MEVVDLVAAVLHVHVPEPVPRWLGRAAQAWLLDQVRQRDPALARQLHAGSTRRPYTISGPRGEPGARWLRFTSVDPKLSALLCALLPEQQKMTLANTPFEITAVQFADHGWAGQASFEVLAQAALTHDLPDSLTFEFATPTAFHSGGLVLPLPMPALTFASLIHAWDSFSPVRLPVQLDTFLEACVGIARHRIATQTVRLGDLEQHIGFTGSVSFAILPQPKTGITPEDYRQRVQMLRLLARFAFYVGVGVRTAVGMGQVRERGGSHPTPLHK